MRTVIEKVIFLQHVDVFADVPSEQLAILAAVAEELRVPKEARIFEADDPADAMYIVVEGRVALRRGDAVIAEAKVREAFGTWALFDDEPRVAAAVALEDTELLRVDREDFVEVLADHVGITQAVLKTIARRLRALGRAVRPG